MPVRPTSVVFDLDGTLLDTSQDLTDAVNRVLVRMGRAKMPRAGVVAAVGDGARNLIERVIGSTDPALAAEALGLFRAEYRRNCLDSTRPYPGIPGLLAALRRSAIPLGLVTNKSREFSLRVLQGLGLADVLGEMVFGDDGVALKPDPAGLRLCLERLAVSPLGSWMVGDSPNDILAGRGAGLFTCAVGWGFVERRRLEESRPDAWADSVAELAGLLGETKPPCA